MHAVLSDLHMAWPLALDTEKLLPQLEHVQPMTCWPHAKTLGGKFVRSDAIFKIQSHILNKMSNTAYPEIFLVAAISRSLAVSVNAPALRVLANSLLCALQRGSLPMLAS
jgi:hypothetical protein